MTAAQLTSEERALRFALERLRLPFMAWYELVTVEEGASADCPAAAQSLLGLSERADLGRYRHPKRRAEFIAGRFAARRAVAKALGLTDARGIEIVRRPTGAPAVKQAHPIHLSISHSMQFAVAAASYHPIGIDLEFETQRPEELAAWFFSRAELRQLAKKSGSDWHGLVNLLWTRKEAAVKLGQWGSSFPFAQLDCTKPNVCVGTTALRLHSTRSGGYVFSIAHAQSLEYPHG